MVREFCTRLICLWKKFGMFMGDTIARVALLLVFWVTVVPIHYIWLLLKIDPMNRKWQSEKPTYFEVSDDMHPDHWKRMF